MARSAHVSHLTVSGAARALGVTRQRVLQLVRRGQLPSVTVDAPGHSRFMFLIPRRAIKRRLALRRQGEAVPPAAGQEHQP